MDNLALQMIDSMASEDAPFIIDSDSKAEWAIRKISEERADTQRLINVCQTFINEYQSKISKYQEQLKAKTGYLESQLQQYFTTVEHKKTKTQETYKLPSGTLKLKYPQPEFVRDDEKLLNWLKSNGQLNYVKTKESVDWSNLKKDAKITVSNGVVVDGDGEIVEGVTAEERPPVFEVEV